MKRNGGLPPFYYERKIAESRTILYKNCRDYLFIVFFCAVLSFGIYNIHAVSKVTEGGIIGLTLLFYNWFGISPSITGFGVGMLCFAFGWKLFGNRFIIRSLTAICAVSVSYRIFELLSPPLWPQLADMPLTAALAGAMFVGVSTGFCVKLGAATAGDDALAMGIARLTGIKIQWVYMFFDITILLLSLTYIPFGRIIWSFLTVTLSGQIIGLINGKSR